MDYNNLCRVISQKVKNSLVQNLSQMGWIGETLAKSSDLKSTHQIDEIAIRVIKSVLKDYQCNIYLESKPVEYQDGASFSIFIDPVDGSLNWERGVGDPCIAIAISEKTTDIKLKDLSYAYVEGFRSGDFYYTQSGSSYFFSQLTQKEVCIQSVGKVRLSEATAYLRPGYSLAKNQLISSFPIFLLCRDIRAIDNAGMEICEIARNAADLMIEARKGSDNFNLLAYPILKSAGGILCDLSGNSLDELSMESSVQVDYIACNNPELLTQTLDVLRQMKQSRQYVQDNIIFSY
ncbi:MAG: inositol monophosphatase family protein [Cyanobacteria bacterium J06592_8]